MRLSKRSLIIVAVALCVVSLALVVGVGRGNGATSAAGLYGSDQSVNGVPYTAGDTSTAETDGVALDPAKQEPVLDKFTYKDPFIQRVGSTAASGTTAPTDGGTGGTAAQPTSADIAINSVKSTVKVGDEVPTSDPQFSISTITSSGVTFTLLNNNQFEDGSKSVTVAEGQVVQVKNKNSGKTYTLSVYKLNYSGSTGGTTTTGGTSGTTGSTVTQSGHSIKVLSIDSQNGTAKVTLVVDGKTYADKAAGAVIATGWGEIKIVSVDAQAQTVVILHGDEQRTLQVGQSFAK